MFSLSTYSSKSYQYQRVRAHLGQLRQQLQQRLQLWLRNHRTRQQLAALQTWQLHDIGISRQAALAEARKPFWRA